MITVTLPAIIYLNVLFKKLKQKRLEKFKKDLQRTDYLKINTDLLLPPAYLMIKNLT